MFVVLIKYMLSIADFHVFIFYFFILQLWNISVCQILTFLSRSMKALNRLLNIHVIIFVNNIFQQCQCSLLVHICINIMLLL